MSIKLIRHSIRRRDIATRMPFKYGIATMTDVPHLFVSVTLEIDGRAFTGQSADHLPPKWFTKEPDTPLEQEIADMERSVSMALDAAAGIEAESAFDCWWQLYNRLMSPPGFPPLLQHFGISLVERAVLDAVCRCEEAPLWQLVQDNLLGINLGRLSPELRGLQPSDFLPPRPLESVNLRHTVGMADYLRVEDIPVEERLEDGLPQSLEACITTYGIREFKLKLSGVPGEDLQRLRKVANVVGECAPADFRFSLDGNEQFSSAGQLREFSEQVYADSLLAGFFEHLIFIEQPINRKVALSSEAQNVSTAWIRPVPIIIDESDGALEDFPRALELGYAGVSHKNCKGVFKGIRNRCLIGLQQQRNPEGNYLMTGEDLANIGPIALVQDLAVQALLGNRSVERNGHHYFRGLSMFPQEISQKVLQDHTDLFTEGPGNFAFLHVNKGCLLLDSANAKAFGGALFRS
ncbi:MAG: enolase C-terminal domain-like protein [Puniceicoccaceae bacterium]